MTSWVRAGPTFTLASDRLAEAEGGCRIGDGDLQPAKLAMPVRSRSPAPRTDQVIYALVQLSRAMLLSCLIVAHPG
jgi:hypothetical protein